MQWMTLTVALLTTMATWAQPGHNITIQIDGEKDTTAILAYHYGAQKLVADTLPINSSGQIILSGDTLLPGGIYILVLPSQSYFEFLIGDDQQFSLRTKGPDFVKNMVVTGSQENDIFFGDLNFISSQKEAYMAMNQRLEQIKASQPDSAAILQQEMASIDSKVKAYRQQIIDNYPTLFYAKFLLSLQDPEVKDPINPVTGEVDSLYPYLYYKDHYWDKVDLTDERMLRTPIYEQKLKQFIEKILVQHPDTIIAEGDKLLAATRENQEMFKYTLAWLLNKYAKRELMGFDAVYVHLADTYYLSGEADWVDKDQLRRIQQDAAKMKPLLIGKTAPDIKAFDPQGNPVSLYGMTEFDYLVLWIYDADCGHCKKETPVLHEKYQEWKEKYNLKVFALSVELTRNHWDAFIAEQNLQDWTNAIDLEMKDPFRDVYDVRGTPTVYILDSNFTIIGKRLSVEQMEGFLEFEEQMKARAGQ